jgi:dihydroorotase
VNPCWLIQGARVVDPAAGRDGVGDLFIRDGRFTPRPERLPDDAVTVDACGLVAVPGLIDLHVHLREPGNEAAETVASGARAAARGGFTSVVAMPNTTPPLDSPGEVQALADRAAAADRVRVRPAPCITRGRLGRELADLPALARAGAVAFTDDGSTVANDDLMAAALRQAKALGLPIMDHALDPRLAGKGVMHKGAYSDRLGLPGIPSEAETAVVERDIRLAGDTGAAMHIQHVSAAGSVALIRKARQRGIRVSAELTPHHLALIDADVRADRPDRYKMNPPLRAVADRQALTEGICDGTIECFATDHAPHTAAAKAKGFIGAPFGVIGLETAVGVTYTLLVKAGVMGLANWIRRWTAGPAGILGQAAPTLAIGAPADFALLDLGTAWTVRAEDFASKSRNTPFEGWTLTGRAVWTFCGGRPTWQTHLEPLNLEP